jgi:hypothetical protein
MPRTSSADLRDRQMGLKKRTVWMTDTALLLGPIAFQEFEVPSGINFGGRHRLALHRLPGGIRIIDALGRDDAQIRFSGIFSGSDATLRARSLDELRASGITLPLTWDVFFYTVTISEFFAEYRNNWWIPYQITCTVLRDEASAIAQTVVSLATAALSDIASAAADALNAGVDLSPLQATLGAPGATVRGTGSYSTAQASLSTMQSSMGASIDSADAALAGVDFANASSPEVSAGRLLEATDIAGQLGSLTSVRTYVARAAVNLANASS